MAHSDYPSDDDGQDIFEHELDNDNCSACAEMNRVRLTVLKLLDDADRLCAFDQIQLMLRATAELIAVSIKPEHAVTAVVTVLKDFADEVTRAVHAAGLSLDFAAVNAAAIAENERRLGRGTEVDVSLLACLKPTGKPC